MRAAYIAEGVTESALRSLNYTPEIARFRRRGRSQGTASLGEMLATLGESYGTVFVRVDCDRAFGEEMLSQADIFAAEPAGRVIRGDVLNHLERHRVHPWQVLIAGTGTLGETELYGRPILADARLTGKILSQDVCALTFAEPTSDQSLFTYAFLLTRPGLRAIRSCSYGTKLLRIRKDLLRSLPIPLPDAATQRRVADLIRATVAGREQYHREVLAARAVIEALPEMREAMAMSRERKARCVLWGGSLPTLTAWTYGSLGRGLALLRSAWSGVVSDVVQTMTHGGRFTRVRCQAPHGVDFLSQRDIFMIRPAPQRMLSQPGIEVARGGELLIAGDGQLSDGSLFGQTHIVGPELEGTAVTEHAVRAMPKKSSGELAYAVMSTPVGRALLRSTAFGTSIPKLNTELAMRLPFPDLPGEPRGRVTTHVRTAMTARAAATAAEREAIRIVEEEVLPAWLA